MKVNAFFVCFSHLTKTFVPLFSVLILYAVVGMSFFQGHIESRCRLTEYPDSENDTWEIDTNSQMTCGYQECPSTPIQTYCRNPADYDISPHPEEYHTEFLLFGYANFNNFQSALFTVYTFLMVTGWVNITQMYWRAQQKAISAIFFGSLVLIMQNQLIISFFQQESDIFNRSQIFSNIILATLYEGFLNQTHIKHGPQVYDEKNNKKKKSNQTQRRTSNNRLQMSPPENKQKNNDKDQEDEEKKKAPLNKKVSIVLSPLPNINNLKGSDEICDTEYPLNDEIQYNYIYKKKEEIEKENIKPVKKCNFKEIIVKIKNSPYSNFIFFANNLMSIIVLCLDNSDLSEQNYVRLNTLDFVVVVILFIEILLTFIAQGYKTYFNNNVNVLDLLILIIHLISYIIELNNDSDIFNPTDQYFIFVRCTKIMRSFQLLYNYKIFESWRIILNTYYFTLQTIPEYILVFIVLVVVVAQIGRELFSQIIPHDNHELVEEMRINFDTVIDSLIASIMILYNEEWHISMYLYESLVGAKSIIYYLISMLICQVLFMRLFIALFINHFMKWFEYLEHQISISTENSDSIQKSYQYAKRMLSSCLRYMFTKSRLRQNSITSQKNNKIQQIHPEENQKNNEMKESYENDKQQNNKNYQFLNGTKQINNVTEQTPIYAFNQSTTQKTINNNDNNNNTQKKSVDLVLQQRQSSIQEDEEDIQLQTSPKEVPHLFERNLRKPTIQGMNLKSNVNRRLSFRPEERNEADQKQLSVYSNQLNIPARNRQFESDANSDYQQDQIVEMKIQSLESLDQIKRKPMLANIFVNKFNYETEQNNYNQLISHNNDIGSPKSSLNQHIVSPLQNKINFNLKMQIKKPINNFLTKKESFKDKDYTNDIELTQSYWTTRKLNKNQLEELPEDIKLDSEPPFTQKSDEDYLKNKENNKQSEKSQNSLEKMNDDFNLQENERNNNQFMHLPTGATEKQAVQNNNKIQDSNFLEILQQQTKLAEKQDNIEQKQMKARNITINNNSSLITSKDIDRQVENLYTTDIPLENIMKTNNEQQSQSQQKEDQLSIIQNTEDDAKYQPYQIDEDTSIVLICQKFIETQYFGYVMMVSILLLAGLLVWDSPYLDTQSKEKLAIKILQGLISFVFILLNFIRIIAQGFKTYIFQNYTNIIDLVTAFTCFLYVFPLGAEALYYLKLINIFRLLLVVIYLAKHLQQIEFAGKLVLHCAPRMIKLITFAIMYLVMMGIIVSKLLKGQSWECNIPQAYGEDVSYKELIKTKLDCLDLGGDWTESLYNYDNIIKSVQILYNIQSSEGWSLIMFDTYDSTAKDEVHTQQKHSIWAIFYIQFFFVAFVCFLNMFVGLVVESYQELLEKETQIHSLNTQQKEWHFIKQSIYILSPDKKLTPPKNIISRVIFKHLIEGYILKIFFYLFIILNSISFLLFKNRMQREEIDKLYLINKICLIAFAVEIAFHIIALRMQFLLSKRNIYNIAILVIGWINLNYQQNNDVKIFDSYYRIFDGVAKGLQLVRVYIIMQHFVLIRKLFKSLHYAISSIKGILLILIIFLYTSVLLSLNLFPYLKPQKTINYYDNDFSNFFSACFTLIRIVTSEIWYAIPLECAQKQQPNFVCNNNMFSYEDYVKYGLNSCGTSSSFFFFYFFYLVFTLIILNIFIATIIESYKQAFKADESAINHYQLDDILKLWTEFDPEGKGYINYKQFWKFSSQIAIIYGVDSKELLDIKNKEKFLKTLDIPIFEDPQHKIFCYKFHDVVIQLSKVSVSIKYGVNDLEPDDDNLYNLLEQNIKKSQIKGEHQIKPTKFTSADMILIILLTRKVREWKKRFVEKEQDIQDFSNLKNITMKLKNTIKDYSKEQTINHQQLKHSRFFQKD